MEPPIDFTAESVRNEKVKVLRSLHTPGPKHVVRGQYGRGFVEGEAVPGYREEEGVARRLDDRDLRRREALRRQLALGGHAVLRARGQAAGAPRDDDRDPVQARAAPAVRDHGRRRACGRTCSSCHIQPDEGVSLAIGAKVPGQGMTIRTVHMDFLYGGAFRTGLPEAYERLILDCLLGDATLFTRADEVEEQWSLVDAIVGALEARPADVPELRGRDLGPGGLGRADRAGTGATGDGAEDSRRRDRARARCGARDRPRRPASPIQRTSVMTHIAWVPIGVGRGGRATCSPAWPSASRRGRSLLFRDPERTTALDAQVEVALLPLRRGPPGLRRGDPAAAAREPAEASGERRRAAAASRPAGLPALARAAAVRRAPVRAAGRTSSTG